MVAHFLLPQIHSRKYCRPRTLLYWLDRRFYQTLVLFEDNFWSAQTTFCTRQWQSKILSYIYIRLLCVDRAREENLEKRRWCCLAQVIALFTNSVIYPTYQVPGNAAFQNIWVMILIGFNRVAKLVAIFQVYEIFC